MVMKKKVALITGASRGIGAATARLLAKEGYEVAINYLSDYSAANSLVEEIISNGGSAISLQADIGVEIEVIELFKAVDKKLGSITALINNAACNEINGSGLIEEISAISLEKIFRTNVFGTFFTCKEAIKRMKLEGRGEIVNVSSAVAQFGGNQMSPYASSKAAINTMTISLAREVATYGIRANTISPGVIDTESHINASPERMESLIKSIPMGRLGMPEEVAKTIGWLLSNNSSYITGANIVITGGR